MSIKTTTYYTCDVCQKVYYSENSLTKISFSYDTKDYKFDCCYECLRGNEIMRGVFIKMVDIIKKWGKK